MTTQLAAVRALDAGQHDGPVHRSIIAVDLEGSTKRTNPSPLVLVVSEEIFSRRVEIFSRIVRHGYVDEGPYEQCVHVRVAERRRRGRVHVPIPARSDLSLAGRRAKTGKPSPSLAIATEKGPAEEQPGEAATDLPMVSERGGPRRGQGRPRAGRR